MSLKKRDRSDDESMAVQAKRAKNIMVSFTKRRQGLFRKASDLCSKFDSQVAVLVLSPSGNPFAFGHSSVDDVLWRYDDLRLQTTTTMMRRPIMESVSERLKRQMKEIEELKARVRVQENCGEALIEDDDDAIRNCLCVDELNGLKLKYSELLQLLRARLRDYSPFVDSGCFTFNDQQNDESFAVGKSETETTCINNNNYGASSSHGSGGGGGDCVQVDPGLAMVVHHQNQGNDDDDIFLSIDFESEGWDFDSLLE